MQIVRLAVVLLAAVALVPARATDGIWRTDGLDHVLLWTDNIDRTTAVFTVRLGFQVRPGGDFGDGVANRLLRLGDGSYIELLYTTRARAELNDDTRSNLEQLRAGTGARTFAVHPLELDTLDRYLRGQGFRLDPPTPLTYDRDGPGPLPAVPSDWRTVSFVTSPITTGDLCSGWSSAGMGSRFRTTPDRTATRSSPRRTTIWDCWLNSTRCPRAAESEFSVARLPSASEAGISRVT